MRLLVCVLMIACTRASKPTTSPPPPITAWRAVPAPAAVAKPSTAPARDWRDRGRISVGSGGSSADKLDPDEAAMIRRRPGANLDAEVDAIRDPYGMGARRDSSKQPPAPKRPEVRIEMTRKRELDTSSLTADAVVAKIQAAYLSGIRRCYKAVLAKRPGDMGSAVLTFTIDVTGHATGGVGTFDSSLEQCILAHMRSWRFPVPRNGSGAAIEARFQIIYSLYPS